MTRVTAKTPAEALRWIDTEPHWIGAASPQIEPTALVLTGFKSIRIPSEMLRDMEGLYTTGVVCGPDVAKSQHRMFAVTELGFSYLDLLDRGVVFTKVNDSLDDEPPVWSLATPSRSYPKVVSTLAELVKWAGRYMELPPLTDEALQRDREAYATATVGWRNALARRWGDRAGELF